MKQRTLLRAVLSDAGKRSVGHVVELSERSAFIATPERPPVGRLLTVELSFRSLVEPITIRAKVASTKEAKEPGDSSGITLDFIDDAPELVRNVLDADLYRATSTGEELPYRVLLVEDSKLISEMFEYGVQNYFRGKSTRVTVDVATDGEEAWRKLREEHYDLAIVDHYLPNLPGSQLIAQVRAEPGICDMPLVAMSVGGREVRAGMLEAGADLFLDKPVLLKDLLATLDRLAGSSRGALRA